MAKRPDQFPNSKKNDRTFSPNYFRSPLPWSSPISPPPSNQQQPPPQLFHQPQQPQQQQQQPQQQYQQPQQYPVRSFMSPTVESIRTASQSPASFAGYQQQSRSRSPYVIYDEEEHAGPSTAEIIANQSQDYVDEKLAEYQLTILQLQDEQERVQKKTFVNWINSYLCKRIPPLRIEDLICDLKDGVRLLALLEVLSGDKLPTEKGKVLRRPHFLSNANTALQFLASKKIKLVNINPADLVDGKPSIVLGLIWTIILYFQIEENTRGLQYVSDSYGNSNTSLESISSSIKQEKSKQGAKKALLDWVNGLIRTSSVPVKDFGPSWRDGKAFMATIDTLKPHQVQPQHLNAMSNRERLDMAFKFADRELGIPPLLDPIDVDVQNPDERSIMTYVGQFLHKYPTRKPQQPIVQHQVTADEKLKQIQLWLIEKNGEFDQMGGRYLTINQLDLYQSAVHLFQEKCTLYKSQKTTSESSELIRNIDYLFVEMENHLRNWFSQLLLANLPEEFSEINQWLVQAEIIVKDMYTPTAMNEETASIISKKLEDHKKFFTSQTTIEQNFNGLQTAYEWNVYQRALIDILAHRMRTVSEKAKQRRIYLKFLEHKCCLIAFLNLVESKINQVKSHTYEETRESFKNMENFVSKNRIIQEFERALQDMKQVIQEYKVDGGDGGLSQSESHIIDKFLYDTECRWKGVHSKLICTQTMLAEALAYWEKWRANSTEFLMYLNAAEKHLTDSSNIAFFNDIKSWAARFDQLTECYQFLTTINGVASSDKQEIDQVYQNICSRWHSINSNGRKLICSQYVSANREKYDAGVKNLVKWIENSEQILNGQPSNNNIQDIQNYGHAIMQIQTEIDDIEELFKLISKTLQELIPDLNRDNVDQMMRQLKTEKEALVRVRALVPIKLHLYHQLLAQRENLEKGFIEIEKWLDQAEQILGSYGKISDREAVQQQLEQHKQFFSRIVYYKSMLDSKNKLFAHLNSSLAAPVQTEGTAMQRMQKINDRFNYVVANAIEWEQKLKDISKSWKTFTECERILTNWHRHAEHYFQNIPTSATAVANDLEIQQQFFDSFNENWMHDFESSASDLINLTTIAAQQSGSADMSEHNDILRRVENNRQLHAVVSKMIPVHMNRLEYTKNQEVMSKSLKMLEKMITNEEQNYGGGNKENVNQVLQRISELKNSDASMFRQTEYLLSILENIAQNYVTLNAQQQNPQDPLLVMHNNSCLQWENICKRLSILETNISQIKGKWEIYHQNFANVSSWMDRVDNALEGILKEVNSEEEFEKEKATFQGICAEADTKREDMKWLVKTLDYLTNYTSQEETAGEQNRLENLIARYKNLIPVVEITMIKTEVFSKCYSYKREVNEIVSLLKKVKEKTSNLPPPQNINQLVSLIDEQQYTMNQLEKQRCHVISMVQRGKDLSKDVHAPEFIFAELKSLETGWNDTFNESFEKLNKLKATHHVWQQYIASKSELSTFFNEAERELRSVTPLQSQPLSVLNDIQIKKSLENRIEKSLKVSMQKIEELQTKLTPLVSVEQQAIIQREIADDHNRLDNILDHVKHRVMYLEDYNNKWKEYKSRLDELHVWAAKIARQELEYIKTSIQNPDERLARINAFKIKLEQQLQQLNIVNDIGQKLDPKEGNRQEADKLMALTSEVHKLLNDLQQSVNQEETTLKTNIVHWNELNSVIDEIKKFLIAAENQLEQQSTRKPHNFDEVEEMKKQHVDLISSCNGHITNLQTVMQKATQATAPSEFPENLDNYLCKLQTIRDSSKLLTEKCNKLEANLNMFDNELQKIQKWYENAAKSVDALVKRDETDDVACNNHLTKLKTFATEIDETQAKLIQLFQIVNLFSHNMDPSIAKAGHAELTKVKTNLISLADKVSQAINKTAKLMSSRQNFNKDMNQLSDWIQNMRHSIENVDYVDTRNLQETLFTLVTYAKEIEAKNAELEQKSKQYPDEIICKTLTTNMLELVTYLKDKERVLKDMINFVQWKDVTAEKLKQFERQDSADNTQDDLAEQLKKSILEWKEKVVHIENNPALHAKTEQASLFSPIECVWNMEKQLQQLVETLDAKRNEKESLKEKKNDFETNKQHLIDVLNQQKKQLESILSATPDIANIEQLINDLRKLGDLVDQNRNVKEKLHFSGGVIIREDASLLPYIQDALNTLDKEWDNLQVQTNEMLQTYIELQYALQEFSANRNQFINDSQTLIAEMNTLEQTPFQTKDDLLNNQRSLQKYTENVKNCDENVEHIEKTGNIINEILTTIKKPSQIDVISEIKASKQTVTDIKQQIGRQSGKINSNTKHLEEIELWHEDISRWLYEINKYMDNAIHQTTEMEYAAISLTRYRDELPAFQQLRDKMLTEIKTLKEANKKQLPKCLDNMEQNLNEQFAAASNKSEQLEKFLCSFNSEETELKEKVAVIKNKINKHRDMISKCDDLSGESEKIIDRISKCQKIQKDVATCGTELNELNKQLSVLSEKYPFIREGGALPRELAAIKTRHENITANCTTVKNNLSNYLKKMEMIKIEKLQAIVSGSQEKLKWCMPEKNCDNHNLNMKVDCLNDIGMSLQEGEAVKQKIAVSFQTLEKMFKPSDIEKLCTEKIKVFTELKKLQQDYDERKNALTLFTQLHQQYIQLSDSLSSSLRGLEDKLKSDANYLIALNCLDEKLLQTEQVKAQLQKNDAAIRQLQQLFSEIDQQFPGVIPKPILDQILLRYENLLKSNTKLLQQLQECKSKYNAYKNEIESFVRDKAAFETQIKENLLGSAEGDANLEQQIETAKKIKDNSQNVIKYLNNANAIAESIYNEITPDCRKTIRNELAALRNDFTLLNNNLLDIATDLEKKLMNRKSIIEHVSCIQSWIQKTPKDSESTDDLLFVTLQEKKNKMIQMKAFAQETNANVVALKEVEKKNANADEKSKKEIHDTLKSVNKLAKSADKKINVLQKYIKNHESYDLLLEKTKDMVFALMKRAEQLLCADEGAPTKNEEKSLILENIINTRENIDSQLDQCQKNLDTVLPQTHPTGHDILKNALSDLQVKWKDLFAKCEQEILQLNENEKNLKHYGDQLDSLNKWMNDAEKVAKDTSLKNSLELKKEHLNKLKSIGSELPQKQNNFQQISEEMKTRITPLAAKLEAMTNRLQSLHKMNRDAVCKYEQFVQNHESFNSAIQKFNYELHNDIKLLEDNSNITGDLQLLNTRSSTVKQLANKRIKDVLAFENLFEDGEKICLQSSAEGSAAIRNQLKNLKHKNDEFLDNLNATGQKLEECLLQFEEFSVAQEQLSKWLSDVETTMRSHTDLKSTLSEKRTQLQNQKIMHQEMLLQNTLVTSVCNKAQLLVEQTKDPSLTSYIDSIKDLFQNIISKSKSLLENLENCMDAHIDLNNATTHLRSWINENKQHVSTYAGLASDKNEIKKHIKQFEEMRDKKATGQKMLDAIDEKYALVAQSTSQQGQAVLKEDIDNIRAIINELFADIDKNREQCKQELSEYELFEKELEELTKWCKVKENSFKSQELMSTAADKEAQLDKFKHLLTDILGLEKRIDSFLNQCAALMQKSGIEKIKNLSNQLSNRYQLLQVLGKEVVKRAQNIYENNKKYDEKLQSAEAFLSEVEAVLVADQTSSLDIDEIKEKLANCEIGIHNVISLSETVLPETSASGREIIRQQIKDIKDRYEKIFIECKNIQNKVQVETLQRSACQEMSEQIQGWLLTMEQNLKKPLNLTSLQECRNSTVKYKSYQHDIAAQKRQIDTLKEKIANLHGPLDINDINLRYNAVKETCDSVLVKLDSTLQYLTHYNDVYKMLDDNQKHLWSLLGTFSILGGNKSSLQSKLNKLQELDNIANYEPKLNELKQLIEGNCNSGMLADSMSAKMQSDYHALSNEYTKLRASLDNIGQQIRDSLHKWDDYQTVSDTLKFWLESTEDKLKDFGLRDTLEEKDSYYQQFLAVNNEVIKKETDFEALSDKISELSQISSSDVPTNRQLNLRFQTVKTTAKECLKKCETALNIHKAFEQKTKDIEMKLSETEILYNQHLADINANDRALLDKQLKKAIEMLTNGQQINERFNEINEISETIYATSNPKGQELVANKLNKLQKQYEELFDKIRFQKKLLEQKLSNISEFNEEIDKFRVWMRDFKEKLGASIKLQDTLDEKKAQQQDYIDLNQNARQQQKELLTLKHIFENIAIMPNSSSTTELDIISKEFATICNNTETYENQYEKIVHDHQNYCKAVMELQEFLEAAANTVDLCSDLDLERVSLYTNLERLTNFQKSLSTELETSLINQISQLGEEVIPNTAEDGQINIRAQIDSSQQEWEALVQLTKNTIKAIEDRIQNWNNYDKAKDTYSSWIRDIDSKLHAIDLKPILNEKQTQLNDLKHLQGEIKAKELEIDDLTERAYSLQKGMSGGVGKTSSLIPDLYVKYQQIFAKIQKLVNQWTGYCSDHHQFNEQVVETAEWLDTFKRQLDFCSNPNVSAEKDLREKRAMMNNLTASKEEGSNKIQAILELASNTISNTASDGHDAINSVVNGLNAQWSQLTLKMVEVKSNLDDSVHQWAGFLDQVKTMKNTIDWLQRELEQNTEFKANISEKRAQLDHLRNIEEKARSEMHDVNTLKPKMNEMLNLGLQTPATVEAQEIIETVEELAKQIIALCKDREEQYRDHRIFKEAAEDLQNWLSRAREKLTLVQEQSLNDRLNVETTLTPLQSMLNKKPQGELLLEQVYQNFEIVLTSTSEPGKEVMKMDMKNIKDTFDTLFKDIQVQKEVIENAAGIYRSFKEDFERISEWLQQMDILVKNNKLALLSTKAEKLKKVEEMKEVLQKIEKGRSDIEKINKFAEPLLKTHLATQTQTQLRHLNSRYEVQLNIGKDVLNKVENNYEEHKMYEQLYIQSSSWINNAKEIIRQTTESTTDVSKENLEKRLQQIQNLLTKKPEGQSLLHNTINYGEKILRNTKSDGKDIINSQLKELQSDWDRCIKKMSTAKVQLETSILQWADYNSKYNHLTQWIRDRELKLTQVSEPQKNVKQPKEGHSKLSTGLNEKKANLQYCDDIVQDIVSFEPMIQSVTSKALHQTVPVSDISSKYETLSKQAKEIFEKQKETVNLHQNFIDASQTVYEWIRNSRDVICKYSEPSGDKEKLVFKLSHIQKAETDIEVGQKKLENALKQGEMACRKIDSEEKEMIEQEVAILQEEFDNYVDTVKNTKEILESAIVKWANYEEKYKEAIEWLTKTDKLVQTYNHLQSNLDNKKRVLEEFQINLQDIFDWQKELDNLNPETLLDICADTRISNGITQLTTKYNALLSHSKEVMKRLELYYQEHQQHNTLYEELQDWLDKMTEKMNNCKDSQDCQPSQIQSKLNLIKSIKQSLEHGQNKLRYLLELKEKVIINTESSGAAKIDEDTENLKQEYETLQKDLATTRQALLDRLTQFEEIIKLNKILRDWINEVEVMYPNEMKLYNDLTEKRSNLEKLRTIQQEMPGYNEIVEKIKAKLNDLPTSELEDDNELGKEIENYEKLQENISKYIENLENQVNNHEKYKCAYNEILDWIKQTHLKIEQSSDPHGERSALLGRLSKLHEIELSFSEGKILLENANDLSTNVINTTKNEGQDLVNEEIRYLKSEWENLHTLIQTVGDTLNTSLRMWNSFMEKCENINHQLSNLEAKIKNTEGSGSSQKENLMSCKQLLDNMKDNIEDLNELCEALTERSGCSKLRDQTVKIQNRYLNLLTRIQDLASKSEKKVQSYADFYEKKTEFDNWLTHSNQTLSAHSNHELDEKHVKMNFEAINTLQNKSTNGEKLISELQDAYKKILFAYPDDEHLELQNAFSKTQDCWNNYLLCIQTVFDNLKLKLRQWEIFNENKRNFANWLNDTTSKLNETTDSSLIELSDMKAKLERLRNTQKAILDKKYDFDELNETAKSFQRELVVDDFFKLNELFAELKERCESKLKELEQDIEEFTEYNSNLQEIEKWLLQMSFQLMAHNSLYIMNTSQALEQISQHDFILTNIENFQNNIDQLQQKGQSVVERFAQKSSHNIQHTIDIQLANIQESYNSLLQTSKQIKNRLMESLKKFQEYENALDSIDKKLEEYEIMINELIQQQGDDLAEVQRLYNQAQDIYKNLQKEKEFLSTAVHSYEAAKACISRPSSPLDAQSQIVPEKELLTRARLEDATDQIHTFLTDLAATLEKLENYKQQKDDMMKWVDEKRFVLNDLSASPAKLHPETASQEIKLVKELLQDVSDARRKFMENLDEDMDETGRLFDEMESQVTKLLLKKQKEQGIIDTYRRLYDATQSFINEQNQSLDKYEKGCKVALDEKITKINRIKNDTAQYSNNQLPKISEMVKQITSMVSNLDENQINEQQKSMEKRFNDLRNRIDRKLNSIENTKTNLNALQNDLQKECAWIDHELEDTTLANTTIFSDSKTIEEQLQKLKSTMREIESKSLSLGSYSNRIMNLEKDMEKPEIAELEQLLKQLQKKHDQLSKKLNGQNQQLLDTLNKYKTMEAAIESAKNHMQGKINDIQQHVMASSHLPLLCSTLDTEIGRMEKFKKENEEFRRKSLANIEKQIDDIIIAVQNDTANELNHDAIKHLDAYKNELAKQSDTVNEMINHRIKKLRENREYRAIFEKESNKLKGWLDETTMASDKMFATPTKKINVLMDQKLFCEKLLNDFTSHEPTFEVLKENAQKISSTVSEVDRASLESELKSLQKRFKKKKQATKDRIQNLEDNVSKMQDAFSKIQQCLETMKQVKERINTASGGSSSCNTEKINNLLSIYESSLQLLRDQKISVASIMNLEIPDISTILHQLEEMISEIEKLLERLKYLLALRSEFIAAVNQIVQFIQKQNQQLTSIESSKQMDHKQKCKEYEVLRDQMADCEKLLQTAKEKGQQIVACGSDIDKNNVDGQISTLEEQLEQLRQIIFNNLKAHHQLYDVQQQLSKTLKDILKWFDDEESNIKLMPTFKLNKKQPNYVVNVIKDYEKLQAKANQRLEEIQQIIAKLKEHAPNDVLPEELANQLAHAQALTNTIPRDMTNKLAFLQSGLESRNDYLNNTQELDNWIVEAEKRLPDSLELNYKKIKNLIENHKQFFHQRKEVNLLKSVELFGNKVKTSMNNDSAAALTEEIDNYKDRVEKLTKQSIEHECNLERAEEDWQNYKSLLDQVNILLSDENIKLWDDEEVVMRDMADVNHHIENLSRTMDQLKKNSHLLEDLTTLSSKLVKNADSKNSDAISNQTNQMEQDWSNENAHLHKMMEKLKNLLKNWQKFDKLVTKITETHSSLFNDFDSIDDRRVESQAQLLTDKQKIMNFHEKLQLTDPTRKSINEVHSTLQPHSMVTNEGIVKKIDEDHARLSALFDKKVEKLELEIKKIKDNSADIEQMKKSVGDLLAKVDRFDPYEKYTEELDQEFVALQQSSQQLKQNAEQMIKSMSKSYLDIQNFVPSDLQSEIDNLESILDQLLSQINEKSNQFNKAKKMKQHFLDSLDHLKKWLANAEVQVENQSYPLEEKKAIIAQTRDEYDTLMADDFKKLAAEGERLKESCSENDEQDIARALQEIAIELETMEGKIHNKYDEVEKALDLRSKFLIYYNDILEWAAKVEKLTNKPLHCQSLNEIRNLCAKYEPFITQLKSIESNLSEMNHFLDLINEVGSAPDLKEKMEEVENRKNEIETVLLENNSLLQETLEEWEQCLKKINSVENYINNIKTGLVKDEFYAKPLRDQLVAIEKMLADLNCQRTKIEISLEKLNLHYRVGIQGTPDINDTAKGIKEGLRTLIEDLVGRKISLDEKLDLIDKYQQEVHQLKQKLTVEEQHLRQLMHKEEMEGDDDFQNLETAREHVEETQNKLLKLAEQIKFLTQTH